MVAVKSQIIKLAEVIALAHITRYSNIFVIIYEYSNIFVPKLFNGPNIRIYSYSNFFVFVFEYQIFGQKYLNIRIYSNIRYALC